MPMSQGFCISTFEAAITRSQTAALAAQHAVKACFATWPSYAAFSGFLP